MTVHRLGCETFRERGADVNLKAASMAMLGRYVAEHPGARVALVKHVMSDAERHWFEVWLESAEEPS